MSARMARTPVYEYADTGRGAKPWRFTLIGGNGEPQGQSQGYATERNLLLGIERHRKNAAVAKVRRVSKLPSQRGKS